MFGIARQWSLSTIHIVKIGSPHAKRDLFIRIRFKPECEHSSTHFMIVWGINWHAKCSKE